MNTMKKFETWLPVFPGFYETIFEASGEEDEVQRLNDERELLHYLGEVTYDMCNFDHDAYYSEVAEKCVKVIRDELMEMGLISDMKFQRLRSPKEYNFANDAVDIEVIMEDAHLDNLSKFMEEHCVEFTKYIRENYTGRDGFIPYHSNYAQDWAEETDNFTEFKDGHKLGQVLEFCLRVGVDQPDMQDWLYCGITDYPTLEISNWDDLLRHIDDDGEEYEGDGIIAEKLSNLGFEFYHGFVDCYRLNRIQEGRTYDFTGFWTKGSEVWGVKASHPALDAIAIKLT